MFPSAPMFLRRADTTDTYKELEEQIDNKFTLLEVMETCHVTSSCNTRNFIFTFSRPVLKCWSVRSGKLQHSVRLEKAPKSGDRCEIYANDKLLLLLITGDGTSHIWSWNYKAKESIRLKREITHNFKIEHFALREEHFVCTGRNEVCVYCVGDDKQITQAMVLKEPVSFMDLSDRGFLYVANGKTLTAINVRENFQKIAIDVMDKILALFEVKMESTSVVMTCHRNHIVRIWKWNLGILAEVNLIQTEVKSNYRWGNPSSIVYSVHYVKEREELVISHNDHITIVDIKSRKLLHLEMHAHRSEICAITTYRSEASYYIMTQSDSEVRLWRRNTEEGMQLVGQITVSNVDRIISVDNVGVYLVGRCYDAGLVLWRDANCYLTERMMASRQFFSEQFTKY